MNRKILGILIGCVSTMLALVVAIGFLGGGMDSQLVAKAEAELAKFQSSKGEIQVARSEVDDWVKADPGLFKNGQLSSDWNQRFDEALKGIDAGQAKAQQLQTLLAEKDKNKTADIQAAITQLASTRMSAVNEASGIRETAKRLVDFKQEASQRLPQIRLDYDAVQAVDLSPAETSVARAITDWPEKETDLKNRLESYKNLKASVESTWQATADARGRVASNEINADDVEFLIQAGDTLSQAKATLKNSSAYLNERIDQLYWSWDKVFEDMEIVEGDTVGFRQKFQITKLRANAPEGETPKTETLPAEWKTVSKQTFDRMKTMQGMTVEHKPAGLYDEEAKREVQPPGYAYIAPEGQRNRYGSWQRHSNGSSFWVFYGQYSFMRNMFGGPRYHTITPSMYRDYSDHRRTGQTYYGKDSYGRQVYGSGGSATKEKYASSRYVSTSGFKNSKYVQSGGSYRGSKYDRKSTTSSRSSRAARSSSSSSKSYRSSRSSGFRSGGFGGK